MKLAALGGFVAAILALVLLSRFFPFAADSYIAAAVMGKDRWTAAADMMQAAEPASYRELSLASRVLNENNAALSRCGQAALRNGVAQTCSIKVTPEMAGFATNRN